MLSIISAIRLSGAQVVLVFAVEQDAATLFDEALRYDKNPVTDVGDLIYFV